MFERFRQDAARWVLPGQVGDPSQLSALAALKLMWRYPGLRAVAWFRFGTWCRQRGALFGATWVQRRLMSVYGIELRIGSEIDGGLYVAHPVGTVVAVQHMGRNCSVIANVTIGSRQGRVYPVIGDHVFVGAGARIMGDIRVGNHASIGANAGVVRDVPDEATVVGISAQVVKIGNRRSAAPGAAPAQRGSQDV